MKRVGEYISDIHERVLSDLTWSYRENTEPLWLSDLPFYPWIVSVKHITRAAWVISLVSLFTDMARQHTDILPVVLFLRDLCSRYWGYLKSQDQQYRLTWAYCYRHRNVNRLSEHLRHAGKFRRLAGMVSIRSFCDISHLCCCHNWGGVLFYIPRLMLDRGVWILRKRFSTFILNVTPTNYK